MPYHYHSQDLRDAARRGRRAIMSHPDFRESGNDWQGCGIDMIADILHALNSRIDIGNALAVAGSPAHFVTGPHAIAHRALQTYEDDFGDEPPEEAPAEGPLTISIEPSAGTPWNWITMAESSEADPEF